MKIFVIFNFYTGPTKFPEKKIGLGIQKYPQKQLFKKKKQV